MVKLATSTGDGSSMWPEGCKSIQDVPNDLLSAFSHAVYILKTSENLMEGEHPPAWMWTFQDELDIHFERMKKKREEKYGGPKQEGESEEGWKENELLNDPRWSRK